MIRLIAFIAFLVATNAIGQTFATPPMPGAFIPKFNPQIGPRTYQPNVGGMLVTEVQRTATTAIIAPVQHMKQYKAMVPPFVPNTAILAVPQMPSFSVTPPRPDGAHEVYPGVFLDQSLRR